MPNMERSDVRINSHETRESGVITIVRPATETLLSPEQDGFPWPHGLIGNEELKVQVERRNEISSGLEPVLNAISAGNSEVSQAVESGVVNEDELALTYTRIADFLEKEADASRLLLYFPFEMIPEKDWKPKSPELAEACGRFQKVYLGHWEELLATHDARANFVDGDIVESEIRTEPVERVSKAAHLLPVLVKKGLISAERIIEIVEGSEDEILRNSIADAIPVLADMNLLPQSTLSAMERSHDGLLRSMAVIVKDNQSNKQEDLAEHAMGGLSEILESANAELATGKLENAPYENKVLAARAEWESQRDRKNVIEKYSREIASQLTAGSLGIEAVNDSISTGNNVEALICINAVRKSMEELSKQDANASKEMYLKFKDTLEKKWQENNDEICDGIEHLWSHGLALGVVSADDVSRFGVKDPKLDANFFDANAEVVHEISDVTKAIESNPELSKYVFPVAIMYGSKVKGYGAKNADIDTAVFIRPGVDINDRPHVQELFRDALKEHGIKTTPLEFWLDQEGDQYSIRDFPERSNTLGNSSFTHVLFGGVWSGNADAIKELYEKTMTGYLHSDGKKIGDRDARSVYLEQMERDSLQYRLMHKGYARFYPEQGCIHTEHSSSVDSESVFWDSGYRRLATKLFFRKVFLPNLDKK